MSTDYTARIEALEAALANGERVVQFRNGDRVEYRSISEIKIALDYLRGQQRAQLGRVRPMLQPMTYTGKGL
jgi:hypothetical protein